MDPRLRPSSSMTPAVTPLFCAEYIMGSVISVSRTSLSLPYPHTLVKRPVRVIVEYPCSAQVVGLGIDELAVGVGRGRHVECVGVGGGAAQRRALAARIVGIGV